MNKRLISVLILVVILISTFSGLWFFKAGINGKLSRQTIHTTSALVIEEDTDSGSEKSVVPAISQDISKSMAAVDQAEEMKSDSKKTEDTVTLKSGNITVKYKLKLGTADFYYKDKKIISDFYSAVKTDKMLTSREYTERNVSGTDSNIVITCRKEGYPTMKQAFIMEGSNNFLIEVTLEGSDLSSNWMSPIMTDSEGSVDIGTYDDNRALFVPFDNDKWIRYNAGTINREDLSYEVSAFYNNDNRNGLVIGSVSHDVWKTGIFFDGNNNKLDKFYAFGGVTSASTRDIAAHGSIKGNSISSPQIFVGFYDDWRTGMEDFARSNAAKVEKMEWKNGVPFGWNSWGKIKSKINYDTAAAVSDFIHEELQEEGFSNNDTVYINLDSYWDNMTDAQLADFVKFCKSNGQKAGIYWAPFVDWSKDPQRKVEGTSYSYKEIWLKATDGRPLELDKAYAVDPTHPGTKARIDYFIDRFKKAGFEYIKLDFLTHGSIEGGSNNGVHYDTAVNTGMQAYNQGMTYLKNKIDGEMFTSLAISPVFPYQYAHARRIACDTFGAINETEYVLNSVSYGWWLSDILYDYNDPDHIVLEGYTADENKSRVTSGVISGTVFLSGDDLSKPVSQELVTTYLTNKAVNDVARIGKSFSPVETNTGKNAADTFVLRDGDTFYIAVFNYSDTAVVKSLKLGRAGLDSSADYQVTELWEGNKTVEAGTLKSEINPKGVRLYKLTKAAP